MQELQIVFSMRLQKEMGFKGKHGLTEYQTRWETPCPSTVPQRDMNNCTSLLLL